jgi:ATP-dependent helicase HrpB
VAAARALLVELGALDAAQKLTAAGREMARLRAAPRLAAMMRAAETSGQKAMAADLAAILEERDPLSRGGFPPADILLRLEALAGRGEADRGAVARIRQAARNYRGRLGVGRETAAGGDPGALLAAAFPDRIGQARGEVGSYRLSGGGSGSLLPADPLARSKLIVVAALDAKGSKIRLAAGLDGEDLPPALLARMTATRETGFDPVTGGVLTRERRRLGALVLSDKISAPAPEEARVALAKALVTRLESLDWTEAARNLQARVALMRTVEAGFPDISDAALVENLEEWVGPYLAGFSNLREVKGLDLVGILRGVLGYENAAALDKALPVVLRLPGGNVPVDYTVPVPVASAKARVFYGVDATPVLAGGRIPLQLALLSPAGRPIAITGDLAGFWRGGWLEARRDMRGRYPKHEWPEKPWEVVSGQLPVVRK